MASRRRVQNPVTTPRRKRRVTPSQIVLNRTPTPQSARAVAERGRRRVA
jgi:hypothetical protein